MLSAILAAKPLVKWGVLIGVPVLLASMLFGWGYLKGRADMKGEWDLAIAQQAAESNREVVKHIENSNQVLEGRDKQKDQVQARIQYVDREVVRYVHTSKPCELDPALVQLFDAISRVPDDPERLPATDGGAGEFAESREAGVTTDEVLQAYAGAVEELALLWVDYAALVQWERGRYIVEQTGFERK